jgi:hypothetical protein
MEAGEVEWPRTQLWAAYFGLKAIEGTVPVPVLSVARRELREYLRATKPDDAAEAQAEVRHLTLVGGES